jgi:subtilisin-like proprotein convertase family protein
MMKILLVFAFFFYSFFSSAQTFTSSINNFAASTGVTTYTQNVSGLPTVSQTSWGFYEVSFVISHPDARELDIELISPAGSFINLVQNIQDSVGISNCTFRIFANKSINQIKTGNITGTLMPNSNGFWDMINGQDPNGIWSLKIVDVYNSSNQAFVGSWTIKFVSNPNLTAANAIQSNLPLVKIFTPGGNVPNSPKVNAIMEVINSGTTNSFANSGVIYPVGVEKQGYTSAGGDKFNVEIEVRSLLNPTIDSAVSLLGFNQESDFIFKGAVTDQFLIKDVYTFEMSRRIGFYAPHTKFVELMIDNVYRGLFIMEEKVKRGPNRVKIDALTTADSTGGYIFEINPNGKPAAWNSPFPGYQGTTLTYPYEYKIVYPKAVNLLPNQQAYLKNFVDSFEYAMYDTSTFQHPTNGWRKWANEKSIIDFMLVSEFSTNYDTYGRSQYFSKENQTDGNKINFGPPWDADRGYEWNSTTGWVHLKTHGLWVFPFWFQNLRQSDSLFNKRLACRWHTIRKYNLTTAASNQLIDSLTSLIQTAGYRNQRMWNAYFDGAGTFKTIVNDRFAWMDANLDSLAFPANPFAPNTVLQAGTTANLGNNPAYKYNFIPGPDSNRYPLIPVGNYIAQVASPYGCQTRQAFQVISSPLGLQNLQIEYAIENRKLKINCNSTIENDNAGTYTLYQKSKSGTFTAIQNIAGTNSKSYILEVDNQWLNNSFVVEWKHNSGSNSTKSNEINISDAATSTLVYPSIATSYINISDKNFVMYTVLTNDGKKVLFGRIANGVIDISSLQSGTYYVQLTNAYGVQTAEKFTKM